MWECIYVCIYIYGWVYRRPGGEHILTTFVLWFMSGVCRPKARFGGERILATFGLWVVSCACRPNVSIVPQPLVACRPDSIIDCAARILWQESELPDSKKADTVWCSQTSSLVHKTAVVFLSGAVCCVRFTLTLESPGVHFGVPGLRSGGFWSYGAGLWSPLGAFGRWGPILCRSRAKNPYILESLSASEISKGAKKLRKTVSRKHPIKSVVPERTRNGKMSILYSNYHMFWEAEDVQFKCLLVSFGSHLEALFHTFGKKCEFRNSKTWVPKKHRTCIEKGHAVHTVD